MPFRLLPLLMLLAVSTIVAQAPSNPSPPNSTPSPATGTRAAPNDPVLRQRSDEPVKRVVDPSRMLIDVLVTDGAGKPVTGLEAWDFKLFDNGHPSKIMFFRGFDGATPSDEPPAEVILVLDLLNQSPQQAAFARSELGRFLGQSGDRLAQPVTLMVLGDKGIEVQARPSRDAKAVAAVLKTVTTRISSINPAMGMQGAIDRFNRSLKQIRFIAENESHKQGRKLLVWVGPGWPMLESEHFVPGPNDQRNYFRAIVDLTNWLRQAHMTVYSVSAFDSAANVDRSFFYQNFTKPVTELRLAESGNLALRVLAVRSGGLALGPNNDVASQIQQCAADAAGYYQLSFEAPVAQHPDEYHALKVTVDQPGVVVRTTAGYYDEPATQ